MPRPGYRARLENGLKLYINRLVRRGFIRLGASTGPVGIRWSSSYWGDIATGIITADMSGEDATHGWFLVKIGSLDQRIHLVARPRLRWSAMVFMCPYLNRRCMVLWMPPGAHDFGCRQRWGRSVAYDSQFIDHDNLAHRGQARIKSRLCSIGGFDPDEWDFPPKPKWMRWRTYKKAEEQFDRYEATLDEGLCKMVARLGIGSKV